MTRREQIRFWICTALCSAALVLSITTHDAGSAAVSVIVLVMLVVWRRRVRGRAGRANTQVDN